MFLVYPILLGLFVGLVFGGRLANLGTVRIRWAALALLGLAVQIVLFLPVVAGSVGALGPPLYVGSSALVLLVALRNFRLPGLPLIAAGGGANLLAILANGGVMPADPRALAALGWPATGAGFSNSTVAGASVQLWPLTDIFALPAFLPGANVFSIGDMLIGLGVFLCLVVCLRQVIPVDGQGQRPR